MNLAIESNEQRDIDVLHQIGERIAAADPLHTVLKTVVELVSAVLKCDSCFVYVLEEGELTLRASKNPHAEVIDRLKLRLGQGITGWVAEHRKPVSIASRAAHDPRFRSFDELPEDRFEAFLSVPILCRDKLVGVINAQHRDAYAYSQREVRLISTIGFLVGPEVELVRMEAESSKFSELTEARQLVEKAQSVVARNLHASSEDAHAILKAESQRRRKSMKEIAEAIVIADEIFRAKERAAGSTP
jgi:signal transduction protein with GAF and PtsI domain